MINPKTRGRKHRKNNEKFLRKPPDQVLHGNLSKEVIKYPIAMCIDDTHGNSMYIREKSPVKINVKIEDESSPEVPKIETKEQSWSEYFYSFIY